MAFLFRKNKVGGEISYYGLGDWWLNSLSEEERTIIKNTYKPMMSDRLIDEGNISSSTQSKLAFLGVLAGWFKKTEHYSIAKKILDEGEKVYNENNDVLDLHYFCLSAIRVHYANRETDADALSSAIKYCELQISIAPKVKRTLKKMYPSSSLPCHTGFQQLAIIYEKQKQYNNALDLTKEALTQGWNEDDCKKRIERLEKKVSPNCSKISLEKTPVSHTKRITDNLTQYDIDEIKKYKQLMDDGIITMEEFEKKKIQLLKL